MICFRKSSSAKIVFLFSEFLLVFSLMSTEVVMHRSKELNMAISRNKNTSTELPWMSRSDLLEGDIVVEGVMNHARASVTKQIYLWSGGLVPYVFDPSLTSYARLVITKAMRTLEKLSCVRFKKRTNEGYFVRFIRGQGCYSYIGRTMDPNGQIVSIGFGCELRGIVLHELMHTLGFFHTSSRPDRDAYVIVYTHNIKAAYRQNFKKYSHGEVDRLGAPYDVTSLMHLPKKSWSNNGRNTIQSRAGPHVILGQRRALSVVDEQQLNQLYKCSNNRGCYFAVGLEKGTITDSQLKASSSQPFLDPHQARLHLTAGPKGNGAWCAAGNAVGEYLQIDLGSIQKVTAIATQGTEDLFITSAWVSGYKIQSSINGNSLSWVTNVQAYVRFGACELKRIVGNPSCLIKLIKICQKTQYG
ncbi:astacin-like metalloprotease toxin 1 isoform X2 [Montipora foliosa]|uniref:astacin-like metalloprotease toxin 1 isoform X2 n=1 Tax=Montipora foliosa TaxID=591990 RepID=UPI0035F10AA9